MRRELTREQMLYIALLFTSAVRSVLAATEQIEEADEHWLVAIIILVALLLAFMHARIAV